MLAFIDLHFVPLIDFLHLEILRGIYHERRVEIGPLLRQKLQSNLQHEARRKLVGPPRERCLVGVLGRDISIQVLNSDLAVVLFQINAM
jgi:hypothetical protein